MKLDEAIELKPAKALIVQRRPTRWIGADGTVYASWDGDNTRTPDPASYVMVGEPEVSSNVITNGGRDFLHTQGYGTAGVANGLNYIALSNDSLTETVSSTTLSTEIAANGLSRAIGVVAHTTGTNTTSVDKIFTCTTTSQACQKAALFTASSSGTMNHALAFTQRTLQVGDTIDITYTITLG